MSKLSLLGDQPPAVLVLLVPEWHLHRYVSNLLGEQILSFVGMCMTFHVHLAFFSELIEVDVTICC